MGPRGARNQLCNRQGPQPGRRQRPEALPPPAPGRRHKRKPIGQRRPRGAAPRDADAAILRAGGPRAKPDIGESGHWRSWAVSGGAAEAPLGGASARGSRGSESRLRGWTGRADSRGSNPAGVDAGGAVRLVAGGLGFLG